MKISNFSENDVGVYTCIASNVMGRANSTIRLYGESPPESRRQGCRVRGGEKVQLTWVNKAKPQQIAAVEDESLITSRNNAFHWQPCNFLPFARRLSRVGMPQRVSLDFNLIFHYQLSCR